MNYYDKEIKTINKNINTLEKRFDDLMFFVDLILKNLLQTEVKKINKTKQTKNVKSKKQR